uniref:small monomeric GTPase n=1 Tax=Crocodylus porosus TaxID=8502 RepID=A0A7M4FH10_CROPO
MPDQGSTLTDRGGKRVQWADGFILVYSICDRASFNILHPKVQFIKATKEATSQEKVPIVIVGNKRDLHHQRVVSSEEGRLLALSVDCGFYEVSAAEAYHGSLMVFQGLAERFCEARLAPKRGTGIRSIKEAERAWPHVPHLGGMHLRDSCHNNAETWPTTTLLRGGME